MQNFTWYPNLAYFDSKRVCRKCNINFFFTKEEKTFWYEKLKFILDSHPLNCISCRKNIRILKKENTLLSILLKKPESELNLEDLNTIILVYSAWGKTEKVKYYTSMLKNMKKSEPN